VGPRAGLDVPHPTGTRIPDHPARSPVTYFSAIPAPNTSKSHCLYCWANQIGQN